MGYARGLFWLRVDLIFLVRGNEDKAASGQIGAIKKTRSRETATVFEILQEAAYQAGLIGGGRKMVNPSLPSSSRSKYNANDPRAIAPRPSNSGEIE